MRRRTLLFLVLTVILVFNPVAFAQRRPQPAVQKRPKLVLLIAVDQFRYDYLERFGDLFGLRYTRMYSTPKENRRQLVLTVLRPTNMAGNLPSLLVRLWQHIQHSLS